MVNSPLIRPYLLGGWPWGGYLRFPWREPTSSCSYCNWWNLAQFSEEITIKSQWFPCVFCFTKLGNVGFNQLFPRGILVSFFVSLKKSEKKSSRNPPERLGPGETKKSTTETTTDANAKGWCGSHLASPSGWIWGMDFDERPGWKLPRWCCLGISREIPWNFFPQEIGFFAFIMRDYIEANHLLLNKALLGPYLPGVGIGGYP